MHDSTATSTWDRTGWVGYVTLGGKHKVEKWSWQGTLRILRNETGWKVHFKISNVMLSGLLNYGYTDCKSLERCKVGPLLAVGVSPFSCCSFWYVAFGIRFVIELFHKPWQRIWKKKKLPFSQVNLSCWGNKLLYCNHLITRFSATGWREWIEKQQIGWNKLCMKERVQ